MAYRDGLQICWAWKCIPILGAGIFCVYASSCFSKPQTESVLHSLASRDFLILKADKDQRNWGRATTEQKTSTRNFPKININFLTDAGKTKGALGFVVLAFFANVFCWRGYSIHLLLPILSILIICFTIDTPFSKEIGYTAGVWFVGALTSSGLCRSVFYFHQLSVGKYLNVPCWPSPKMSLRMAGDWATQN